MNPWKSERTHLQGQQRRGVTLTLHQRGIAPTHSITPSSPKSLRGAQFLSKLRRSRSKKQQTIRCTNATDVTSQMQDSVHFRTAVMRTGTVRSLLPGRTQRLRYAGRSPPVRRTGVVRSSDGGLDALLNEILEKHRRLYGTGEEEEEERPKRILKKGYDYADRQNIWPSAEGGADYIRLPPMNQVGSAKCLSHTEMSSCCLRDLTPRKEPSSNRSQWDINQRICQIRSIPSICSTGSQPHTVHHVVRRYQR